MDSRVLAGQLSSDGFDAKAYIKREIKKNKFEQLKKKRLSPQFWIRFKAEFRITVVDICDSLPDPPENLDPDKTLVQMLLLAHSDNPAQNKIDPISKYLMHCQPLHETSLYGLISRMQECESLPKHVAVKIQIAFFEYARRCDLPNSFPLHWNACKDLLDRALQYEWEEMASNGTTARTYAMSVKDLLCMFCKEEDVDAVIGAGDVFENVSEELARIMVTHAGRSMYRSEWSSAARKKQLKEYDRMLAELEYQDYMESEIDAFQDLCKKKADYLVKLGHKQFEIQPMNFVYFGEPIEGSVSCPNDDLGEEVACCLKGNGGGLTFGSAIASRGVAIQRRRAWLPLNG